MTAVATPIPKPPAIAGRLPFYYGWVNLLVAALAMVATLPGRTQGLGLITEPLLADLGLDRIAFAQINLWATLIGAAACIGFGRLIDRLGARIVLTALAIGLGGVVLGMGRVTTVAWLAVAVTLTRALGQSALSVASLSIVPQWFTRRLPTAMALYTVALSIGFMAAFPLVGEVVVRQGWRVAWNGIGWALLLGMAPIAWLFVRRSPESCGLEADVAARPLRDGTGGAEGSPDSDAPSATLSEALRTPAFWVFGIGSALYGLVASGIGLFNESILAERGFDASAYHLTLVVTAMTALAGNFLGGWLAGRWPLGRLMAVALALLATGLVTLPHLRTMAGLMAQAVVMGLAGGFVTVLFFTVWARVYGREHLGLIQGAAQTLTVTASAVGPLLLAQVVATTGSYATAFRALAVVVAAVATWAVLLRMPPARTAST
ncbi:MAG: MFS transporter [Verrucomicrobiota bacterium]